MITLRLLPVSCALLCIVLSAGTDRPLVKLSTGLIEGRLWRTAAGNVGFVYLGVPFAEPPLGKLRFAAPVRKSAWSGVVNCTSYKNACWAKWYPGLGRVPEFSEDCLHVNVFVGSSCSASPCPVIYYVHGGGWKGDTPLMFNPETMIDNLASEGVVLVTVGYRLGSLGFFRSRPFGANYGYHDVVEALRWTNREVANFGGDPRKITVMGHSSGGNGVSLLMLSPRTADLFQQAIFMSGTAFDSDTLKTDLQPSSKLANALGCDYANLEHFAGYAFEPKLLDCLRAVPASRLIDEQGDSWGPQLDGPDGLFPAPAPQLAENRRPYPILTGTDKYEFSTDYFTDMDMGDDFLRTACSIVLRKSAPSPTAAAIDGCTQFYRQRSDNRTKQISLLVSDIAFFVPTWRDAADMASRLPNKVYLYSFDYEKPGYEGNHPRHSDDLVYIMGVLWIDYPVHGWDETDLEIRRFWPKYFTNFVKFGKPTPSARANGSEWQPLEGSDSHNYYTVTNRLSRGGSVGVTSGNRAYYHKAAVEFWTERLPALEAADGSVLDERAERPRRLTRGWWLTLVGAAAFVVLLALVAVVAFVVHHRRSRRRHAAPVDETTALIDASVH